ncbi:hypothetical protein FBU30_007632 [Linnemannia zychae]|nr:hypothetical protein FBU30_007632 [Linnemannia zychae]
MSTDPNIPLVDSKANVNASQQCKKTDYSHKFLPFECFQALYKCRLPTNSQLDDFLAMIQNSLVLDSRLHMLSEDGQALHKDFQQLLQTFRSILIEKNEQELFQNFIYHCRLASESIANQDVNAPDMSFGVSSGKAKKEGKTTLNNLLTIAKLVTMNSEFRAILHELFVIAREIFSEGVGKLSQSAGMNSGSFSAMKNTALASATEAAQSVGDMFQKASDRVQNFFAKLIEDPVTTLFDTDEMSNKSDGDVQDLEDNLVVSQSNKQAEEMKNRTTRLEATTERTARNEVVDMEEDMGGSNHSKLSVQKRRELVSRLKIVITQIQSEPQYQKAISSMLHLFGNWRQRIQRPLNSITTESSKLMQDPNVNAAIVEFKYILQRWAQGYSPDPIVDQLQHLWRETVSDDGFNKYIDQVSRFLTRAIRDPRYVNSHYINADAGALIDRGRVILYGKCRHDIDMLLEEIEVFLDRLNTDPKSVELATNFEKIVKHLLYNKQDKIKFKTHLLDDFRYVVLPAMIQSINYIPMPHIEYSSLKIDLVLDNLVFSSTDFLPRLFEFKTSSKIHLMCGRADTSYTTQGSNNKSMQRDKYQFKTVMRGLVFSAWNVNYFFRTKRKFKFTDRGVADLLIHKKGMDITIIGHKTPSSPEIPSLVTIDCVKVKIHNFTFKPHKSMHPTLYTIAYPILEAAFKRALIRNFQTKILKVLNMGDQAIGTFLQESRIKTGKKSSLGALITTTSSFIVNKIHPNAQTKLENEHKKHQERRCRTSRVIFDENGLCVLNPVKHMELKLGKPLIDDPHALPVEAPWVSPAFSLADIQIKNSKPSPGMRRSSGSLAL